mgnify:FL=1
MTTLDFLLILALVASVALGVWRNLAYEVVATLGLTVSFVMAQWLAPDMAQHLSANLSDASLHAWAFAIVFVLLAALTALMAWLIRKLILAMGMMRPFDRALGATFGFLRGLVLLLTLTVIMNLVPYASSEGWRASAGGTLLTHMLQGLKPVLPQVFGRYLPG